MTQTPPDLVRPTLWRLHLRTVWSASANHPHQVEGAYLEDALKAAQEKGVNPARVTTAEFLRLDVEAWQQVPQQSLQEAIVLVMRT